MSNDKIVIKGAREHNLKNVSLTIPRDKLVVMTGLSGQRQIQPRVRHHLRGRPAPLYGKPFQLCPHVPGPDGKAGCGQHRGAFARHFHRPENHQPQPRSTVGTVTEIHDYLRLLYARIGIPHCPVCGRVITQQTVDQMVDAVLELPRAQSSGACAGGARRKGTQQKKLDAARQGGYARVRVDGNLYDLEEGDQPGKNKKAHGGDRGGPARSERHRAQPG